MRPHYHWRTVCSPDSSGPAAVRLLSVGTVQPHLRARLCVARAPAACPSLPPWGSYPLAPRGLVSAPVSALLMPWQRAPLCSTPTFLRLTSSYVTWIYAVLSLTRLEPHVPLRVVLLLLVAWLCLCQDYGFVELLSSCRTFRGRAKGSSRGHDPS